MNGEFETCHLKRPENEGCARADCCRFQQFFSHIKTVSGCARELNAHFHSAASLKYHAPDTWHDTTPSHIILTLGRPVLAPLRKSWVPSEEQLVPFLATSLCCGSESNPFAAADTLPTELPGPVSDRLGFMHRYTVLPQNLPCSAPLHLWMGCDHLWFLGWEVAHVPRHCAWRIIHVSTIYGTFALWQMVVGLLRFSVNCLIFLISEASNSMLKIAWPKCMMIKWALLPFSFLSLL